MQYCGQCGNYNSSESIFCGQCGHRLNNNCPSCGFANLADQKFCGSCGKQVQSDTEITGSALRYGQGGASGGVALASPDVSTAQQHQSAPAQAVIGAETPASQPIQPAAELDAYALVSIEVANWDALKADSGEQLPQLEAARQEILALVTQRVSAAGGQVQGGKQGVLFIAFRWEPSVQDSLEKAVEITLDLLAEEFSIQGWTLRLKAGMDIEKAQARDPLSSTLERSVSMTGTLTVSEAVCNWVKNRYPIQPVGPVQFGNRAMQFYRVSRPEFSSPPSIEPPSAPPLVKAAEAFPPEFSSGPTFETSPADEAPPAAEPSAEPISELLPESPESESPQEPVHAEHAQAAPPAKKQPVSETLPPDPVMYDPPLLGEVRSTRSANLNYEQAIEALTSDLSAFLAQGGQGETGKGRVIALCASDGLGKSNIINMVRGMVDADNQRAIWLGGHHYRSHHRVGLPLSYWLEMMQNLLSLVFEGQPVMDVKEQITKFLSFVHGGNFPQAEEAFLDDFLCVRQPQPLSLEARHQLGRIEQFFFDFLKTLAAKRPLVLVLEDLQFADAASLALLCRLLEKGILDAPVMLLLTQTRDFYASGRLAGVFQKIACKELVIADLDEAQAERFLDDGPLGGQLADFPMPFIAGLLQASRGLPLYLEEALRWFHLKEVLAVDPQSHKFVPGKNMGALDGFYPPNVRSLVRLRQEFLDENTAYVLRLAAVLGEKFAVGVLMALSQLKEEDFNQALTTLFNHGYLVPDAVNTGRFRHGLLWEAVYDDVDEELRLQMHQLASEALENDFKQGLTVNPLLIAYHAESGRLPVRALNYWNLAGIYAGQLGSLVAMNIAMFKALDLLRASTREPLHTQELALRTLETVGAFNLDAHPDLSIEALGWVCYYRKLEGDFAKLIEPLGFLASAYELKGQFADALDAIEQALDLVDAAAYPLEKATLLAGKLEHLYTLGRLQEARQVIEHEIEPIAAEQGYAHAGADFYDAYLQARLIFGQVLLAQCDPQALQLVEETLGVAQRRGLDGLIIALQLVAGQIHLRLGQYERCNQDADGLLSAIEAMDNPDWFLAQWGMLAIMYHCEMEDWESAAQLVLTVMAKSEEARDHLTWIQAQVYAGHISAKSGKTAEARQVLEQAVALAADHQFAAVALLGWRFLAEYELSCGAPAVAWEIANRALQVAEKPENRNVYEAVQLKLISARALMAQDEIQAAGKLLEPLWPEVVKARYQPLIAACAFEIGHLYKRLAQTAPSELSKKHLMRSVEFFLKAKGIWLDLQHMSNVKRVDAVIPRL